VVDPAEPKFVTEYITFNTGCATDVCVADLKISCINARCEDFLRYGLGIF